MKQVGPRITTEALEIFLTENFRTLNAGCEYTLEAFYTLYRHAIKDLKGKFSAEELKLIIDVFNSTALTANIAGQHLLMQCVDGMELDGLDQKWRVDRKIFTEKLKSLTRFQSACIEIWANGFWYGGDPETKELDIEKHIKPLLGRGGL